MEATSSKANVSESILSSVSTARTEVFYGIENATKAALYAWSQVMGGVFFDSVADKTIPSVSLEVPEYREGIVGMAKRGVKLRYVLEVTKENLPYVKEMMRFAEIRHLEGVIGNFGVGGGQYIASSVALTEGKATPQIIYSNVKEIVEHQQYLFLNLWNKGIPCVERIREIEEGIKRPRIEVMRSPEETLSTLSQILDSAKKEILMVFSSSAAFHRGEGIDVIGFLEKIANSRDVRVRMLIPFDDEIKEMAKSHGWDQANVTTNLPPLGRIVVHEYDPSRTGTLVTIVVVDRSASLVVELRDDTKKDFADAIGFATYSTSKSTVMSYAGFFEQLWYASELRDSEARARDALARALNKEEVFSKQARLLQDILAHDIRNYNQVIRLGVDVLSETLVEKGLKDAASTAVFKYITDAVDGSILLLERAKKLGRVLSEQNAPLRPVSLTGSIESAMELVRRANSGTKTINYDLTGNTSEVKLHLKNRVESHVLADELLDEVFANIYSNSVKYTDSEIVQIDTRIDDDDKCWKVTISDRGRGIPGNLKEAVFTRYLSTAKGSGLGMSIVHALVVERYKGNVQVVDRVPGDSSKGTSIEMRIPKAD